MDRQETRLTKTQQFLCKLPPNIFTVITLIAICWATLTPDPFGGVDVELFPGADKVAHFIMFGFLSGVFIFDTIRGIRFRRTNSRVPVVAAAGSTFVGAVIEILQQKAGRSMELGDLLADCLGAVCVSLAYYLITKWNRSRK